ncbi:unnamed protein product [Larinioides sclopetarius]|uniref:Uncharacterized protein n=1 Tax=Larinioides sclopetarius TaxID=280406 RepID=A0AAV2AZE3_9ARAC
MIRNLETESLAFGEDDEFHRRLDAFNRLYLERIRMILWIILRILRNSWFFLKYLSKFITDLFLRRYIATIVLVLSVSVLPVCIVVFRDEVGIVTIVYCLSFFACSILSLLLKKGSIRFACKKRSERRENLKLLAESNSRIGQGANRPAGYGAKDQREPLKRALDNLREPRLESKADSATNLHRSNSFVNTCDESSAGTSRAPECTNYFKAKSIIEDSYDSDEPSQRLSVARIAAEAVKTFGPPLQVFGADSYRVLLNSSDENLFSDESVDVKKSEASVEVHHSDTHRPLNSRNDGSSSAEPVSVANDENAVNAGSNSFSNLAFTNDDQTSEIH